MKNNIRELRKQRHINQTDFAKMLNTSQARISMFEKGMTSPGTNELIKMARFFKCSIDYILGYEKQCIVLTPEEERLVNLYRVLDIENRQCLHGIMDSFVYNRKGK